MTQQKTSETKQSISRDDLAELLNQDLARNTRQLSLMWFIRKS
jgi:hypothetical protein